jgi:hypothetical protein
MKTVLKIFFLITLLFAKHSLAFDDLPRTKNSLGNPLRREYLDSKFHFTVSQGFGIRNTTTDFGAHYQFRQLFSVGILNGFHRNKVNFYSNSDKHKLKLWSYPIYVTGDFYLFGTDQKAVYVYGRYGRSFGINNKNNDPDKNFQAVMAEGGIGYELLDGSRDKSVFFELGQYYTNSKGTFYSTYDSIIDYTFKIYSVVFRFGLKI